MGHEVLGDEIQELKHLITSLNNSTPLGKKSFFQRATGIAAHFATDKTVDVVWDAVKPHFSELLLHQIPNALGKFLLLNP